MQNDVSMMQYLQYYVSLLTRHVIEIDRWGSKCTLQLLHSGIKIRQKVSFIRTDVVGCANSEGLLTKNISDRLESLFFPQGRVSQYSSSKCVPLLQSSRGREKQELKKTYFPLEQQQKTFAKSRLGYLRKRKNQFYMFSFLREFEIRSHGRERNQSLLTAFLKAFVKSKARKKCCLCC